jgi:hypothetical protein
VYSLFRVSAGDNWLPRSVFQFFSLSGVQLATNSQFLVVAIALAVETMTVVENQAQHRDIARSRFSHECQLQ